MNDFPFPVHAPRHVRDMHAMSRGTAFAAEDMLQNLFDRRGRMDDRRLSIVNTGGFYQNGWPEWEPEIRATGGSPSLATADLLAAFQPDPADADDVVGHIAVGFLDLLFNSGCSVGTGTFGFTLPRRPKAGPGALIGFYTGHADTSPLFLPVRGPCLYSTIGGEDVVVMALTGSGLLSSTNPGTWDMNTSYLILNLMYEVEEDESS